MRSSLVYPRYNLRFFCGPPSKKLSEQSVAPNNKSASKVWLCVPATALGGGIQN